MRGAIRRGGTSDATVLLITLPMPLPVPSSTDPRRNDKPHLLVEEERSC